MIFNFTPSREFENNTSRVNYLVEESYTLYEDLSVSLLSANYYDYLERWGVIRDQQKKMIIELNKLSIPA